VGAAITVTSLGQYIYGISGPVTQAHGALALYAQGLSGTLSLVVSTPSTLMSVGKNEIAVTPKMIAAGTYWLFGQYDTEYIDVDCKDPMQFSAPYLYTASAYDNWPNPFPKNASAASNLMVWNYYLVGTE
jgi:hypothetical protein